MAAQAKKSKRAKPTDIFDRTVIYHGIKIPPVQGKLSPTAKAIREAFREKLEQTRAKQKRT